MMGPGSRARERDKPMEIDQTTFDEIAAADVQNTNHRDDLFQLFSNLLQNPVVTDDHKRHSR